MDIGIAVLTRNRCKELIQVIGAIKDNTLCSYNLAIVADRCSDNTLEVLSRDYPSVPVWSPPGDGGAPAGRNIAFYNFRHKDIVFVFEDDFLPAQKGWEGPYLRVLANSKTPCLFALSEAQHGGVTESRISGGEVVLYRERLTTQMVGINTCLLNTLGYFNPAYGTRYGFEDSEWGCRGLTAGLFGGTHGFPCLHQDGLFLDISNPTSSDGKTKVERDSDIAENFKIFASHMQRPTFLPYPYLDSVLNT